jgi:hypothetical protein
MRDEAAILLIQTEAARIRSLAESLRVDHCYPMLSNWLTGHALANIQSRFRMDTETFITEAASFSSNPAKKRSSTTGWRADRVPPDVSTLDP